MATNSARPRGSSRPPRNDSAAPPSSTLETERTPPRVNPFRNGIGASVNSEFDQHCLLLYESCNGVKFPKSTDTSLLRDDKILAADSLFSLAQDALFTATEFSSPADLAALDTASAYLKQRRELFGSAVNATIVKSTILDASYLKKVQIVADHVKKLKNERDTDSLKKFVTSLENQARILALNTQDLTRIAAGLISNIHDAENFAKALSKTAADGSITWSPWGISTTPWSSQEGTALNYLQIHFGNPSDHQEPFCKILNVARWWAEDGGRTVKHASRYVPAFVELLRVAMFDEHLIYASPVCALLFQIALNGLQPQPQLKSYVEMKIIEDEQLARSRGDPIKPRDLRLLDDVLIMASVRSDLVKLSNPKPVPSDEKTPEPDRKDRRPQRKERPDMSTESSSTSGVHNSKPPRPAVPKEQLCKFQSCVDRSKRYGHDQTDHRAASCKFNMDSMRSKDPAAWAKSYPVDFDFAKAREAAKEQKKGGRDDK